jgi:hypothetical protein
MTGCAPSYKNKECQITHKFYLTAKNAMNAKNTRKDFDGAKVFAFSLRYPGELSV